MPLKFSNNAVSVLPATVLLTDPVFSVTATHGSRFPALAAGESFVATIQNGTSYEIVEVTSRVGDTFTALRGREGTASQTWPAGSSVSMRFTRGTAEAFVQQDQFSAANTALAASIASTASAASAANAEASPVGHILLWPGVATSAPSKFLFCAGQAVSRTTYAALYAVVGNQYGAGDGTTTFNLPDLRGRVPVGRDNMGGTNAARISAVLSSSTLGAAGGHQNLQTHTHVAVVNDPGHAHTYALLDNALAGAFGPDVLVLTGGTAGGFGTQNAATNILVTNQNSGTGNAQNVQPSIILNYIIFAGV